MMQLIDFSFLSLRQIPLERIRLQGRELGIDLVNKMEDSLQFAYTHVGSNGISVRLVIQCHRPNRTDVLIPAAPSAFFFFKEDPMILTPKPFLVGSVFQKSASKTIPLEYRPDYEDALSRLDQLLASLETQKEDYYEHIH